MLPLPRNFYFAFLKKYWFCEIEKAPWVHPISICNWNITVLLIVFWRLMWYIRLWKIVCNGYSWGSWNGTQSWRFRTDHEWYFCRNQDGLDSARSNVARQVNNVLLNTYWNISRITSEHEQTVPTMESRRWKSWLRCWRLNLARAFRGPICRIYLTFESLIHA